MNGCGKGGENSLGPACELVGNVRAMLIVCCFRPSSQHFEPLLDLECHQPPPLFEEVFVCRDLAVKERLRHAVHSQASLHIREIRDAAIFLLAARALLGKLAEVLLGRLVSDGNVDLALREHEIGHLIVAALRKALALQVLLWKDVVRVAAVHQEVLHCNVTREETLVSKLHLRCLIRKEIRTVPGGRVHKLRQHPGPEAVRSDRPARA